MAFLTESVRLSQKSDDEQNTVGLFGGGSGCMRSSVIVEVGHSGLGATLSIR